MAKLITKRMAELRIKNLQEFADRFGIGRSTLYDLVRGRSPSHKTWGKPSLDTLVQLANALEKPLHELIYLIEPEAPGANERSYRVRVNIAGWCSDSSEQKSTGDWFIYVEEEFAQSRDLRAFKIRGDSMAAGKAPIHHGDIVLVDAGDKGYNTASVVARLLDDSYVCKVLKDDKFGQLLQSRNVDHTNGTPSAIPISQVAEIVGRVVRIIHDDVDIEPTNSRPS